MNANVELATLTQVIDSRDFHSLERAKIDESYFFVPEAIEVYRWIRDIYHNPATQGEVPSRELLHSYFPTFQFWTSTDSVIVLAEQLRRSKISVEVQLFAQDLMMKVGNNPLDALATIQSDGPRITSLSTRSEDFTMAAAAPAIRERYQMVKNAHGVIGIPYPWKELNEATQGMRDQNFIVIYGRPKSMKTWFALKLATFAYTGARRRVLFYSREMSPIELQERVACLLASVDYTEFMGGRLQPASEEKVYTVLEELADDERNYALAKGTSRRPYFMITSDQEAEDAAGVSWLKAKIEELDPDIAFVDGMYLLRDDRSKTRTIDWKNITHISQDLKSTARHFNIPIIGITQARRSAEKTHGEDLTELAFADAIGMDADAIYRVKKEVRIDPVSKLAVPELFVGAPGLRSGIFEGMQLRVIPGHTFEVVKVFTALDIHKGNLYEQAVEPNMAPSGTPRLGRVDGPFLRSGQLRDPKVPPY